MIMIDDLGWTDLRIQGNARLETPVIDRLASQGMIDFERCARSAVNRLRLPDLKLIRSSSRGFQFPGLITVNDPTGQA